MPADQRLTARQWGILRSLNPSTTTPIPPADEADLVDLVRRRLILAWSMVGRLTPAGATLLSELGEAPAEVTNGSREAVERRTRAVRQAEMELLLTLPPHGPTAMPIFDYQVDAADGLEQLGLAEAVEVPQEGTGPNLMFRRTAAGDSLLDARERQEQVAPPPRVQDLNDPSLWRRVGNIGRRCHDIPALATAVRGGDAEKILADLDERCRAAREYVGELDDLNAQVLDLLDHGRLAMLRAATDNPQTWERMLEIVGALADGQEGQSDE